MSERTDSAGVIARALTVLGPYFDAPTFKVSVSRAACAEIRFAGPVGKGEIDRLMRHLEVMRDSFPEEAEAAPSVDDLARMIRAALASPASKEDAS